MRERARAHIVGGLAHDVLGVRQIAIRFGVAAALLAMPAVAHAQAWAYPSFQSPRVTDREFNFAVADAGRAGTSLVFQWREGISNRSQLSLDVGFADPDGRGNGKLLLGGQFAGLLTEARSDLPLDFLGTVGLNLAVGNGTDVIRIPFGVSVGHRFPLEDGFAITPYVHPRVSLDFCTDCSGRDGRDNDTDLGIDFDLGVHFEVTRNLGFRVSAIFGGSDRFGNSDGFGIGLSWRPAGLSRLTR